MTGFPYRPFPVVLAAASGTGKTTLARALVAGEGRFCFSVSATTRAPRPRETDGVDYHFVDRPAFEAMIAAGELVEWAEVHGELYGTPRRELDDATSRAEHVVLDIDVQGARQIRESVPDAVLVFLLPPSVDVLLQRLTRRGTEANESVARRLRTAMDELDAVSDFHHVVVNDDLDGCLSELRGIVKAEARRASRLVALERRVDEMRAEVDRVLTEDYSNVLSQEY